MMSEEQFQREKMYQATMNIVKTLCDKRLMTDEEYSIANALMLEKYHPVLGCLMAVKR